VKKTSVYLDESHAWLLKCISEREGRPQAEIIRDAIDAYDRQKPDRNFALARVGDEDMDPRFRELNPFWQMTEQEIDDVLYDAILDDSYGGDPPEHMIRKPK